MESLEPNFSGRSDRGDKKNAAQEGPVKQSLQNNDRRDEKQTGREQQAPASGVPRQMLIPSRRTAFEPSSPRARSSLTMRGTRSGNPDSDRQASTRQVPAGEVRHDNSPHPADLPTDVDLATAGVTPPFDKQENNHPVAYHDTSAAERAWQKDNLADQDTHKLALMPTREQGPGISGQADPRLSRLEQMIPTRNGGTPTTPETPRPLSDTPTTPLPLLTPSRSQEVQPVPLTRKTALFFLFLLVLLLVNANAAGFSRFFGPQGWGSVFDGSGNGGTNLLTQIAGQLHGSPTPGGNKGTPTPPTPTQIVNLLLARMTLDEKLGQMMMIQFAGQSYSPDLDAMISQYHVGAALYFQFNIGSKSQVTGLNAEMQQNASLPLLTAVDQEGGTVDRLVNLDGPQPSATEIGATGNPNVAYQQGVKDARDLTSYGFNFNLAPVVDVHTVYNWQMAGRTFGSDPATVIQFAGSYLKGLQQAGKVLGSLKHFPGLGDVSTDPHYGLPALTRSLANLNTIDWAPYDALIKQGNVDAIMVTHEIVDALDKNEPSSLSPQVIGVLRNQMHFQGVILTDSLTMDSIHNFYTYGEAAAKAIEAGDDLLMGADSPSTLAQMITGIKQAMNAGTISQQRIDDSVRRILLFKYKLGLLHV